MSAPTNSRKTVEPIAWMRRWFFQNEKPVKVLNPGSGRMALPGRFKWREVSESKILDDDIPLCALSLLIDAERQRDEARELLLSIKQSVDNGDVTAMTAKGERTLALLTPKPTP